MSNGERSRHALGGTDGGAQSRPRDTWRPGPKVRPCLKCGQPRISASASDRLHPKCRPAGEQNDGEAAALVLP